jgi:hypothetical protein
MKESINNILNSQLNLELKSELLKKLPHEGFKVIFDKNLKPHEILRGTEDNIIRASNSAVYQLIFRNA